MDAKTFLAHFGAMVNAPGGIAQMRILVRHLALQGKLVQGHEDAASTRALLDDILNTKKKLIASKQLRRQNPLPAIEQGSAVASHPDHWIRVRFGAVWNLISGRDLAPSQYNSSNNGIPYITGASNISGDTIAINRWTPAPVVTSCTGDLLITCKGTIGKTVFNAIGDVHIARQIMAVRDFSQTLNMRFLKIWLDGYVEDLKRASKSMIPGFSRKDLNLAEYPLMPTEEQARIVAKVDELMALCDQLEAQQQARRQRQNQLRRASLDALAQAESPHELQTSWQRLASNFGHLFSTEEDVDDLRSTVLDLAVTGALSSVATDDESAERLIARSEVAKANRIECGGMKRKKLKATTVKQHDWATPRHWREASLTQLFQFIDYRGKTPTKTASGVVLVTAKNVRPGRINKDPVEYVSEQSYEEWMTRGFPQQGDLLFTTEAPMGNVARIESDPNFALAQRIICFQPFADVNTKCLMYFLMSPMFQQVLEINGTGMTAKGIKAAKLKQIAIPIPPVQEQARIVERADRLLQLCNELSHQLGTACTKAERLATAAIATLTGIDATDDKEPPMRLPKTTLDAPVRLGKTPSAKDTAPLAAILLHTDGELDANDLYQRFGGEIDAFYAQLKAEVAHGWIKEPAPATVRELTSETTEA